MPPNKEKIMFKWLGRGIQWVLDKISKAGYDSLTDKEKELLFRMSDKK